MKKLHALLLLTCGIALSVSRVASTEDNKIQEQNAKLPEYLGLVDWSHIHSRKSNLDERRILIDGFIAVRLQGDSVNLVRIYENKEALEYNRDLMFINVDIESFLEIAKKSGIVELADLESLDGSFVQINARFSLEVPVDNALGTLSNFDLISVGGGGRGKYFPRPLDLKR